MEMGPVNISNIEILTGFLFNEPRRIRKLSPGDFTRYTTDSGNIILEARGRYISITFLDNLNDEIREKEAGGGKGKNFNE